MTKRFVRTKNTTWTWYYIKTKFRNSLFVQQVHCGPILDSTGTPFVMFFFSGESWGLQKLKARHIRASRAMCPKQYESVEKKPTDAKRRQQRTWEKMERMAHNGSRLRQPGATSLYKDGISTSSTNSTTKKGVCRRKNCVCSTVIDEVLCNTVK